MALLAGLMTVSPGATIALVVTALLCATYLMPWLTTFSALRCVPGPMICRFSNLWIVLSSRAGKRFYRVNKAHQRYGKVVRVGYNHVSIANEDALAVVYGHGNGFLKDHFYEAFVSGVPGVFNTRDRAEHSRKRKLIANAFSPRAVSAFEGHMTANIVRWTAQLDGICNSTEYCNDCGYARLNIMPWCSFLAFDIIGDLVFGRPFGMIEKGKDECESKSTADGPVQFVSAVETLNRRGEVSSTLGWAPQLRWLKRLDPFLYKGLAAVKHLHGMAVIAVDDRQARAKRGQLESRVDILALLIEGKDASGQPMARDELVSESLTQLIAGSDTISNTLCAVVYWILHGERSRPGSVMARLLKELDAVMGASEGAASWREMQQQPFLRQCIDEAMRLHSTSAIGLPRIVTTSGGIKYNEYYFPQGTVLSVPSYTIHHDAAIWGPDVEEFKPDRWTNMTERQKICFNPFSYGPRACVGQNIARMELAIIIGTLFHRYDMELYQETLESHEGFSKKPTECYIGIKRRR